MSRFVAVATFAKNQQHPGTGQKTSPVLVAVRGGILAQTKRFNSIMTSSCHAEGKATLAGSDAVLRAQQLERVCGTPREGPTVIGTDSSANFQLAMGMAAPGRLKHIARQWAILQERIREGGVRVVDVPDASMPADFLTKWLAKKKVAQSLARATNSANAVPYSSS